MKSKEINLLGSSSGHINYKRFYTLVETLKIHGEIEYGTGEIDVDALVDFLENNRSMSRFWNCSDEDVEKIVMEDILNGAPVWTLFKLPLWTKKMLAKEYEEIVKEAEKKEQERYQRALKEYKCLQQCRYYDCADTSYGTFIRCNCSEWGGRGSRSGEHFKYMKKCSKYEKDETKSKKPIYVGE